MGVGSQAINIMISYNWEEVEDKLAVIEILVIIHRAYTLIKRGREASGNEIDTS